MADKNNTALSICVDKVLDHVGASEQIRRNQMEKGMVDEIVTNLTYPILYNENVRWHNFGSWVEGTTTKGLNSDMDKLFYDKDYPAVEEVPDGFVNGYLIINDATTKPGYVKLQTVYNGIPAVDISTPNEDTDHFGRVFLSSRWTNVLDTPMSDVREHRHGPAFTIFGTSNRCRAHQSWKNVFEIPLAGIRERRTGAAITTIGTAYIPDIDRVYAIRCYSVPSSTRGWIHRPRKYGWPSKQQLENMSTHGCFLVDKGHPSSQTQHLEWRISFPFQERELMFSLNSAQHKCYILLKMIKQDLVSKIDEKSISSYHLKTSLFHMIENNPIHIWIPENLVYCTELCLKQLLDWLNNENCPNFFVPEENMFDRLSSRVMKMAAKFIQDMLDSDGQYLKELMCDEFGELLQDSLSGNVLKNLSRSAISFDLNSRIYILIVSIHLSNKVVTLTNRKYASDTLGALQLILEQLRKLEDGLTSEKVFRWIKKGLDLIIPNIHLQIAQTISDIRLTMTDADKKHELMQVLDHQFEQAQTSNDISLRLIKANMLFKENKFEECDRILVDCETLLNDCMLHTCSCMYLYSDDVFKNLIEQIDQTSLSLIELRKYLVPCLMFLPSQADLAPTPLQYEMYRSVGADTDTLDPDVDFWFGTIAVHPRLYLFFLQYLVYTRLNKHELAEGAKLKLDRVLRECTTHYFSIGHLETGFSLLGWINKQEKDIELAMQCFYRSWKIRPDHNAAKWHMLVMMYEQFIQRSKR